MPQLLWSITASPRYILGSIILDRYEVIRELSRSRSSQIIEVIDIKKEERRVIRVLTRYHMKERVIRSDIAWFRHVRTRESGCSRFINDYVTINHHFLIFARTGPTLEDLLQTDQSPPFSMQEIREISEQVIQAAIFLHREYIVHSTICPRNIEFMDNATLQVSRYNTDGVLESLRSSKVKLCFYGQNGSRTGGSSLRDLYKAPETVLGWKRTERIDNFAIGCVLAELVTGYPLFCTCERGRNYIREKLVAFDRILGPIPERMGLKIEDKFPGTFDIPDYCNVPVDSDISATVQYFADNAMELDLLIRNKELAAVIRALTNLRQSARPPLDSVLQMPFFLSHES